MGKILKGVGIGFAALFGISVISGIIGKNEPVTPKGIDAPQTKKQIDPWVIALMGVKVKQKQV